MTWDVYNMNNSGLSGNRIYSITADNNGDKWFGSQGGGLSKYDGTMWTTYNTSNSGLPNNSVRSIVFDMSGMMWIGTDYGLAKFDGITFTSYTTMNSGISGNTILSIDFDSNDDLWLGTEGGGISMFDGSTWTTFTKANSSLPSDKITGIAIDASDAKWISTDGGGVARFETSGTWTIWNTLNSNIEGNLVYSICIDNNDNPWSGTCCGLCMFNGVDWDAHHMSTEGTMLHYITDGMFDQNGVGWFGLHLALIRYDGTKFEEFNTSNSSIPGNAVTAIYSGADDKLWVGTNGSGLGVYYDEQQQTTSIATPKNSGALVAAPIPTSGLLVVKINIDQQADLTLSVFDILGNQVYQEILLDQFGQINKVIDTNDLPSGMYILQAASRTTILTQRIIVE